MSENVIPFNVQERLLAKVQHYISSVDQLICDGDEAIEVLLAAFAGADEETKIKIVLLLGTLANSKVVDPLLAIMQDNRLGESIRQAAAIQVSVVGGLVIDKDPLVDRLLEVLKSETAFDRANAAFALGWEGNLRAAPQLIECLFDEEGEVQQAAVNALSNLQEDQIFFFLAERLQKSAKEQQRAILYNLCHFSGRHNEISQICKTFVHNSDADLRYDALVVLKTVSEVEDSLELYEHCLKDDDARIRELALTHLAELAPIQLVMIEGAIRTLLTDDFVKVCQAAVRLVHKMHPATVVPMDSP